MFFETSWGLEGCGLGAAYALPGGVTGGQGDPVKPSGGSYWQLPAGSGSEPGGTNAPPGSKLPGPDVLRFNCTPEYIAKYKAKFGRPPYGCGQIIPPEAIGTIYPETQTRPVPRYILPPPNAGPGGAGYEPGAPMTGVPVPPVPETGGPGTWSVPIPGPPATQPTPLPTPVATVQPRRRVPRPRRRAAPMPRSSPTVPSGEICPSEGYVTRPLPGTHEYGIFPCRRGQPYTLDQARMASLTAGAKARGLSGFDEILGFIQQPQFGLPIWAWAAAAIAIFMVVRRGRR